MGSFKVKGDALCGDGGGGPISLWVGPPFVMRSLLRLGFESSCRVFLVKGLLHAKVLNFWWNLSVSKVVPGMLWSSLFRFQGLVFARHSAYTAVEGRRANDFE